MEGREILLFTLFFSIYTLDNLYIFYRGWKVLPTSSLLKGIYCIVFFIFYSAFIIAMLFREIFLPEILKPMYLIGTLWLGATLYLTIYFLITDIVYLLFRSIRFRQIQVISGYLLVGVVLCIGYYRFNHPQRVEKTIVIHKDGGKYEKLKVVAFGDLHLGMSIDKKKLQKHVQRINAEKPDIILFSGDMVDNSTHLLEKEKMYEEINQLQAPLGVYSCLGNHEYLSNIKKSYAFFQKTNLTLLIDSVVQVEESFWIIGRDDKKLNPNRESLETLVQQTDLSQPLILLDHQPYSLEEAEKNGIDIQLSGHTHNGQIWPGSLIANYIFEVAYGYKQKGDTHIYVTSGLGLWGPPLRLGTQSEWVVFNIEFK